MVTARIDYHLTMLGRVSVWSTSVIWFMAGAALLFECNAMMEMSNNAVTAVFLFMAGIAAVAAFRSVRRATDSGWVATTYAEGFAGCAEEFLDRKAYERVEARWEDVRGYDYGWSKGRCIFTVAFTDGSSLGEPLTINISNITPSIETFANAFAEGTGKMKGIK